MPTLLTSIDEIPSDGSYLFTVEDEQGKRQEIILVTVEDGIRAWKNFCLHETDQRLDRGDGVVRREDQSSARNTGRRSTSRLASVSTAPQPAPCSLASTSPCATARSI